MPKSIVSHVNANPMGKFINPFTDIGFKRIFGQEISKPLLLDFLNNLLKGEKVITNITFLDKEQPSEYRDDRSLIYDVFCETDDNERIIVEMQNREHPNFASRCLYYASQAISRQGERGPEWWYNINAVYMIAFVNFYMDELDDNFRTDVELVERQTGRVFTDKERFIFLQLPCFTKDADECGNDFERWIYLLKNMETLDRMPWAAKDSVFRRLAELGEVSNMTKEERMKYDSALRHYRDTIVVMQGAVDKGRAEGRAEANLSIARNLKAMGLLPTDIAKATGLSLGEIEKL